jgi:uncharacterized protein (TIGR00369 family)
MTEPRYGVATAAEVAGLTGLETLQAMIAGRLPAPPIARIMSFRLVEAAEGFAVFEGDAIPDLLNPLGIIHGGWALTLIDSACGCALHASLPANVGYTTIETKVNFARMIRPDGGKVRAEGRIVTIGRRLATSEAKLTDKDGRVVAHGTSTLMILPRE